jgi:hypothetical protein
MGRRHEPTGVERFERVVAWPPSRRVDALAVASILLSPLLVVYEFVVGLVLLIVGSTHRLMRPGSQTGPDLGVYGIALLAGPLVYLLSWMLGGLFNW